MREARNSKNLAIVLVVGEDQTGIVAQVSDFLWKENINIEDINQKIMQGVFVMTMLVDISRARSDLGVLGPKLEKLLQPFHRRVGIHGREDQSALVGFS